MITSVAMEKPAFAYQFIVILMQVPGIDLSQARGRGVHWKIETKTDAVIYERIMPSMTQHTTLKGLMMKIRRYKSNMEAFVVLMLIL
jgi:hypothetical protein